MDTSIVYNCSLSGGTESRYTSFTKGDTVLSKHCFCLWDMFCINVNDSELSNVDLTDQQTDVQGLECIETKSVEKNGCLIKVARRDMRIVSLQTTCNLRLREAVALLCTTSIAWLSYFHLLPYILLRAIQGLGPWKWTWGSMIRTSYNARWMLHNSWGSQDPHGGAENCCA